MTRFSICLPVRNGWPYVRECVESILLQSYPHFTLHVLDNQSTDQTVEWLEGVGDERLRLSESSSSLSIEQSWARVKDVEKEEFMTVIGHDDLFDPEFLSTVMDIIDRYPDAALYQTGSRLINANGQRIRGCRPVPERETAAEYLKARFCFERDIFGTGYVMRSCDYESLGGIPPFEKLLFADDALWLSLMRMRGSYKANDPREKFAVRIHPGSESASLPSAWMSILQGLNQFTDFLRGFVLEDDESRAVFEELGGDFLLRYHQNLYIFALVQACQARRRIDVATVERLESSLLASAPSEAGRLGKSVKVKIVSFLNASPLRWQVTHLWRLYSHLKTRSSQ
jgi:glycosyltransferase involved in cell wall biosynthesis